MFTFYFWKLQNQVIFGILLLKLEKGGKVTKFGFLLQSLNQSLQYPSEKEMTRFIGFELLYFQPEIVE